MDGCIDSIHIYHDWYRNDETLHPNERAHIYCSTFQYSHSYSFTITLFEGGVCVCMQCTDCVDASERIASVINKPKIAMGIHSASHLNALEEVERNDASICVCHPI